MAVPFFHADHVGSLLRPRNLTVAFRRVAAGEIGREEFRALQDALPAQIDSPSVQAAANEQAVALARALEKLPDDFRQVLRLRYEEGRPFEEIASRMDRSANAVRKLFARAVMRVQQEVEAMG